VTTPQVALEQAAQSALSAAATNAASTGVKTSEFWVYVLAAAGGTLATLLIPGVGGLALAGILSVGAATYGHSRGNVKAAALAGAAAGLSAAASSTNTTVAMAAKTGVALIASTEGVAK
jgi:hypothetical protein